MPRRTAFDDYAPWLVGAGMLVPNLGYLRGHVLASLHPQAGAHPTCPPRGLGHASVAVHLDRYGHLYPGDAHPYVDRLGEVALAARADHLRTSGGKASPTATDDETETGL